MSEEAVVHHFRLIAHVCGWRTWVVDDEPTPEHECDRREPLVVIEAEVGVSDG